MSKPGDFHKGYGRLGSQSHAAKLDEAKVLQIRMLLRDGISAKELAARFGVTPNTIYRIRRNEIWTHVKLETP